MSRRNQTKRYKYRIRFCEETVYEVEFETNECITDDGGATGKDWFEVLDKARPDWPTKPDDIDVVDRALIDLQRLR